MENTNKEILEAIQMLATKMDKRFDRLEQRMDRMEQRMDNLEKKVDAIQEEVADLKEWRTTVDERLDHLVGIEEVTMANCYEIARLKVIK